jgi:HEAT repeat protein
MNSVAKRALVISTAAVVALGLVGYAVWSGMTRSETGIGILSEAGFMPTSRLVANLKCADVNVQRESLGALARSVDPAGLDAALPLLKSRDAYVWLNAALYVGSLKRPEAVPYLIKGLRHYAWHAHPQIAAQLTAITGQKFGPSYQPWRNWWDATSGQIPFDFDNNLGGFDRPVPTTAPASAPS